MEVVDETFSMRGTMNSLVRVGNMVYDENKKVVAEFTHGAWYERREKLGGKLVELAPLDADRANVYGAIEDALKLEMRAGELDVISTAEQIMQDERGTSSLVKNTVSDTVREGVLRGLCKFGPFDPKTEVRDLDAAISKCLRNAMVYSCMRMLMLKGDGRLGRTKHVFIQCSKLYMMMKG